MQIPGFYVRQKLQCCLVPTAEQGSDPEDPCFQVHPRCLSRETQVHPVCTAWKPPPRHWQLLGYGPHTHLMQNSLTWRHLHKSKPILLSSHWKYPNWVFCKLCCVGKFGGLHWCIYRIISDCIPRKFTFFALQRFVLSWFEVDFFGCVHVMNYI